MDTIQPYETIDLYLKGKLSNEEKYAFEKKLASDESLQKLLKIQESANQVVVTKQLMKLKAKMSADIAQMDRNRKYRIWFFISSGVLTIGPVSYTHLTLPTNREV